jgi:hypothetical protein
MMTQPGTYDDESGEMADSWTAARIDNPVPPLFPYSDQFPVMDLGPDYVDWLRSLCGKHLQMPMPGEIEPPAPDYTAALIAMDYAQLAWENHHREIEVKRLTQTTTMRVEDAYLALDMNDAEEEQWMEREIGRGDLAGCPETIGCYECGGFDGVTAPERKLVALGRVVNRADPTQTYVLACGHTVI